MTALDRAFIRAYVPKEATPRKGAADPKGDSAFPNGLDPREVAVTSPSVVPLQGRDAVAHPPEAVVAPHATTSRGNVWAALEQPPRTAIGATSCLAKSGRVAANAASGVADAHATVAAMGRNAAGPTVPTCDEAANPARVDDDAAVQALPTPSACPSPASEEIASAKELDGKPAAMSFASYASDLRTSGAAETTLSAYMRLRNAAAQADSRDLAASPLRNGVAEITSSAVIADPGAPAGFELPTPEDSEQWSAAFRVDSAHAIATPESSASFQTTSPATPMSEALQPEKPSGCGGLSPFSSDENGTDPLPRTTVIDSPIPSRSTEWRTGQVERFTWPKVCRRLITRASEELDQLTDAILDAKEHGRSVLAISGWHHGEGATTLLLCAARRLAERGIKPVLVDADLCSPRLAKRLGVDPLAGWDQVTGDSQGVTLDQAVIEATVSGVSLAPACEPSIEEEGRTRGDCSHLADCLAALRQRYDMVLVDVGPLENVHVRMGPSPSGIFEGIDAVVLVRDLRLTSLEQATEIHEQLTAAGVVMAGIIENFAEV